MKGGKRVFDGSTKYCTSKNIQKILFHRVICIILFVQEHMHTNLNSSNEVSKRGRFVCVVISLICCRNLSLPKKKSTVEFPIFYTTLSLDQ